MNAASVKAKLFKLAKRDGRDYNRLLLLYVQERFLARLASSSYRERFILKGGLFLYAHYGVFARPTRDLDFLGRATPADLETLATIMCDIAGIELQDGVRFASESIQTSRIKEDADYEGVRIKITGYLDKSRQIIQIDVGFGDVVKPQILDYPTLLEEHSLPKLLTYSLETVIAEKFQAMLELSVNNSRAKDFYDIYQISLQESFEAKALREAIIATFRRRESKLEQAVQFLAQPPINSPILLQGWQRLRFANPTLKAPEKFEDVLEAIRIFLDPLIRQEIIGQWQPDKKQWQ